MEKPSCREAVVAYDVVPLCAESGTRHLLVQREGLCHDGILSLLQRYTNLLVLLVGFLFGGIDRVHGDRVTLRNGGRQKGLERIPIRISALLRQYIVIYLLVR